jgi:hypothetical protein
MGMNIDLQRERRLAERDRGSGMTKAINAWSVYGHPQQSSRGQINVGQAGACKLQRVPFNHLNINGWVAQLVLLSLWCSSEGAVLLRSRPELLDDRQAEVLGLKCLSLILNLPRRSPMS